MKREIEIKVGLFVTMGVGLLMLGILVLGGRDNFLAKNTRYVAHFPDSQGLFTGAKVLLGGLAVGQVDQVDFDPATKDIRVDVLVERKYSELVREGSQAELATQGLLGDKFISITIGEANQPKLPDGATIPNKPSKDLAQILSRSDQLVANLGSAVTNLDQVLRAFNANGRSETFFRGMAETAKNLSSTSTQLHEQVEQLNLAKASKNLNATLEKINNGTGTLGALVNDPGLYEDIRALFGGASRNRVVRNLVRKTVRESEEAEGAEDKAANKK